MALDELRIEDLRRRTGTKWAKVGGDVLPAWIADMDFALAPVIVEALVRAIDRDGLGYPAWPRRVTPLRGLFSARMLERYGWHPDPGHVREYGDTIQALQVMLHTATEPGDGVAVHVPCYPPFLRAIAEMRRRVVPIPYVRDGGQWRPDESVLARRARAGEVRCLVLVNPHNPTGRVLQLSELQPLAECAAEHDLLVVSDEIHADLTYQPARHIPFASLGADAAARTVTLTSATKAFNLAGIRCTVAHIGPAGLRKDLDAAPSHLFGIPSNLSVEATTAAWQQGDEWLAEVLDILHANRRDTYQTLNALGFTTSLPEASYLMWFRRGGATGDGDIAEFLLREARVRLTPGEDFGPGGESHVRLNFATSPAILTEILRRITAATGG